MYNILWKATNNHHICSDHFENSCYIIPPSLAGACQLKKYAIPSRINDANIQPYVTTTHPYSLLSRLQCPYKRPHATASVDNDDQPEPPPEKIPKITTTEDNRDMLEKPYFTPY